MRHTGAPPDDGRRNNGYTQCFPHAPDTTAWQRAAVMGAPEAFLSQTQPNAKKVKELQRTHSPPHLCKLISPPHSLLFLDLLFSVLDHSTPLCTTPCFHSAFSVKLSQPKDSSKFFRSILTRLLYVVWRHFTRHFSAP